MSILERKSDDLKDDIIERKLSEQVILTERTNELYRKELKRFRLELSELRSTFTEKENIIKNLQDRYKAKLIPQDNTINDNKCNTMDARTKLRKIENITQRTINQNFQWRVCHFLYMYIELIGINKGMNII